jgi:hypothetical protein
MSRSSWRFAVPVLALLVTLAVTAEVAGAVVPVGESTCANSYDAPPLAHPGHERWIYLSCNGPATPDAVTIDQPAHGHVRQATTVSYLYTPDAGFEGTDHFTLRPAGGGKDWTPQGYDVLSSSTQDTPPVCQGAGGQTLDVRAGESRPIAIGNCSDDEGDPLTYEIATEPAHGTHGAFETTEYGTHRLLFAAAGDYTGPDTLSYRARDDFGQASGAVPVAITIRLATFNRLPTCSPLVFPPGFPFSTAIHGTSTVSTDCSDLDGDPLAYTITSGPAHGAVTYDPQHDHFVYTADAGYAGSDTWSFSLDDGHGGTATGSRTVDVVVGHDPVCHDLELATAAGTPVTADLPCSDGDGDEIVAEVLGAPTHGTLSFDTQPHRHLTYTPDAGFSGTDTATMRASDSHGGSAPARRRHHAGGSGPVTAGRDTGSRVACAARARAVSRAVAPRRGLRSARAAQRRRPGRRAAGRHAEAAEPRPRRGRAGVHGGQERQARRAAGGGLLPVGLHAGHRRALGARHQDTAPGPSHAEGRRRQARRHPAHADQGPAHRRRPRQARVARPHAEDDGRPQGQNRAPQLRDRPLATGDRRPRNG